VSIPEELIRKVMELLSAWNPLGDRSSSVQDLNDYRTEAIDILFTIDSEGLKATPARIVRDVLNQAFDLELSLEECRKVSREILEQISDTHSGRLKQ